jgi:hypothetical protein
MAFFLHHLMTVLLEVKDSVDRFNLIVAGQMLEALNSAALGGADPCHWGARFCDWLRPILWALLHCPDHLTHGMCPVRQHYSERFFAQSPGILPIALRRQL